MITPAPEVDVRAVERAGMVIAVAGGLGGALGLRELTTSWGPGPGVMDAFVFGTGALQWALGVAVARTRRDLPLAPLLLLAPILGLLGLLVAMARSGRPEAAFGAGVVVAVAAASLLAIRMPKGKRLEAVRALVVAARPTDALWTRATAAASVLAGLACMGTYGADRARFWTHLFVGRTDLVAASVGVALLVVGLAVATRTLRSAAAPGLLLLGPAAAFVSVSMSPERELGSALFLTASLVTSALALLAVPAAWRLGAAPAEPRPPRTTLEGRRLRWTLVLTVVPAVLLVVLGWLWLRRPFVDDATLGAVAQETTEALREARRHDCPRAVLRGEATPGDGTDALGALVDPRGRFASCARLVADRPDAIQAALQWNDETSLELPEDDGPSGGPMIPPPPNEGEWDYVSTARTLRRIPLPIELEVVAACDGLDTELERVLQHASLCTPYPTGEDHEELVTSMRLAKALAILARHRLRNGDVRGGLELLLDVVRFGNDLQRGHPDLTGAMIGNAVSGTSISQLQGLVATDLGWRAEDLLALEAEATVLGMTQPSPAPWLADDGLHATRAALERRGWTPPLDLALGPTDTPPLESREEIDAMIAYSAMARPRLLALCEGAATSEACALEVQREVARAEADSADEGLARLLPFVARDGALRVLYATALPMLAPYVRRGLFMQATVRALPVLFVHRRLALEGSCPDAAALEAAIAPLPLADGFGGRFEVLPTTLPYRPLDICAPAWMAPAGAGRVRLPVLNAYCPAFAISDAPVPMDDEGTTESE